MRRLIPLLASLAALALAPAAAHAYTFYEWDATAGQPTSVAITSSTVYHSLAGAKDIGRSTLGGASLASRTNPSATSRPQQLAAGQNGDVWFADPADDVLGRVAANGTFTTASTGAASDPVDVAVAPNGNVWAVENTGNELDCIAAGGMTVAPTALTLTNGHPTAVAIASDGVVWVADHRQLGRASNAGTSCAPGTITPIASPGGVDVSDLTPGPNGGMYVAAGPSLSLISTAGTATPITLGTGTTPNALHADADGNAWYVDTTRSRIGKVTGTAAATEWVVPHLLATGPTEFALAPDKALWYAPTG